MIYTTKFSNKNLNLIGISGKIGSGKDTICQIIQWLDNKSLQEFYVNIEDYIDYCKSNGTPGLNTTKINDIYLNCKFAFKIKQIVSILTGIPIEDLEKPEVKMSYLPKCWNKKKKILNWFGTMAKGIYARMEIEEQITVREFMQKVGTDALKNIVHPDIWINSLYSDFKPENKYIISDVRFIDEAESVLQRNGLLIRVNRDNVIEHAYKNHISETQLDDYKKFDIVIHNNSDIKELVKQIQLTL